MRSELSIGNDIVDLRHREPPLHSRFHERVFAPSELLALEGAPQDLWIYWAAKEAAYKTLKRIDPSIKFHPREFVLQREAGVVMVLAKILPCVIEVTSDFVSAVCATERWILESPDLYHWRAQISESEDPSMAVRREAKERISEVMRIDSSLLSVEKHCDIPHLYIAGRGSNTLMSFSHHGRFIATAFFTSSQRSYCSPALNAGTELGFVPT